MGDKNLQESFEQIYNQNFDSIFRFCISRVSDQGLAEDLTQVTFIRVWNYLLVHQGEVQNMRALLYKIAKNLIIDDSRRSKSLSLDNLMNMGFDPSFDDHERAEDILDTAQALKVMDNLDSKYKDLIQMRYIEEFSPKEISVRLGLPEKNICVKIHRALKQLQKLLETNGMFYNIGYKAWKYR